MCCLVCFRRCCCGVVRLLRGVGADAVRSTDAPAPSRSVSSGVTVMPESVSALSHPVSVINAKHSTQALIHVIQCDILISKPSKKTSNTALCFYSMLCYRSVQVQCRGLQPVGARPSGGRGGETVTQQPYRFTISRVMNQPCYGITHVLVPTSPAMGDPAIPVAVIRISPAAAANVNVKSPAIFTADASVTTAATVGSAPD